MSQTVIKIENLSKQYRLGLIGTGTLSHDLNRWWANITGKEDPMLKIGHSNQLDEVAGEWVWALKDVNFEVKQGEVLGIIGKNGAGKSTLLKILSRVTGPTTGRIQAKGRIASLLEVGTGFHPELTGKENIYLNGAILGMTKTEITNKFDEIVDFSGVEKYIATPVKRYSSGMYVRLAFAVAAHLEPEILVVDEVLAVGDAEFQKKCLGKMKDITGEGRTVLFVSHNLASIRTLCNSAVLLQHGMLTLHGDVGEVTRKYISDDKEQGVEYVQENDKGKAMCLTRCTMVNREGEKCGTFKYQDPITVEIDYTVNAAIGNCYVGIAVLTVDDINVIGSGDYDTQNELLGERIPGNYVTKVSIPEQTLRPYKYYVRIFLVNYSNHIVFERLEEIGFEVLDTGSPGSLIGANSRMSVVQPLYEWTTVRL